MKLIQLEEMQDVCGGTQCTCNCPARGGYLGTKDARNKTECAIWCCKDMGGVSFVWGSDSAPNMCSAIAHLL